MKFIIQVLLTLSPLLILSQSKSVNISVTNGKTKMMVKQGNGHDFSLEYEGEITLNDDDSDVVDLSPNGYFEIKKSGFGSRRRVYIEKEGGVLVKTYFVGSKETPFDPEGKKWLSEILLEVVRTTTLGAEKRVARLYEKGGVNLVLKEIDQVESGHVSAIYLKYLLEKDFSEDDAKSILKSIGNIDSDHHRADVLSYNMKQFTTSPSVREAFIKATGEIDSDHHKAEILKQAIRNDRIDNQQLSSLFAITKTIDSDHHKADILLELLQHEELDDKQIDLLLAETNEIDSDHHKANVLMSALDMTGTTKRNYQSLITSLSDIDSDHHKANILSHLLKKDLASADISEVMDLLEGHISSSHHKGEILQNIIRNQKLDEEILTKLVRMTSEIESSHLQGQIFYSLSRTKLSEQSIIEIFDIVRQIESSHSKLEILTTFAPKVRSGSQSLKEAYMQVVNSMDSTHSKGRALEAIE